MWICGAHGENNRETGIVEEIQLESLHRNPMANWTLWDSVLYEKARFQEGLTLLLNTTCTGLEMDGSRIESVSAWGLTNETRHTVKARLFADCSGDAILAPLSGAAFRIGREAADEFDEDIEPPLADSKTMGMSCILTVRETDRPQRFIPPSWANVYGSDNDLRYRSHDITNSATNFWWIELGGEEDSIHDTEAIRDELLKTAFGVWDHIKNRGDHGADNWVLDWVGFLPGKRESRRYLGDHVLTQNDIRAEGRFEDVVAYGGWSMDDHHPGGVLHPGKPTIFHPAPSPYGIPYRSLYSRNVDNLFCAGRNISATHAAMSSTRVMATCSLMGQAVGTAAAIAARRGIAPREIGGQSITDVQQALMEDDCWLPGLTRAMPDLSAAAELSASEGDPEPLRSGVDRPVGKAGNGWAGSPGTTIEYRFPAAQRVTGFRCVFDSDLNRARLSTRVNYPMEQQEQVTPPSLVKAFRIEIEHPDGAWQEVYRDDSNYQRLVKGDIVAEAAAVRLIPESTWGDPQARVFAFDVR
jgi:hypothetical protein